MNGAWTIAKHTLQESLRRRVLLIVLLLTVAFGVLYWFICTRAFDEAQRQLQFGDVNAPALVGATLIGLSMFGTLFLGTVLGAFLTLGTVRGEAERGTLQPLVVRPIGRAVLLLSRFLAAAVVCAVYVVVVFFGAVLATWQVGDWTPDRLAQPAIQLAAAVAIVVALSVLGSVFLNTNANGIAVFMLFGGGLVTGLVGQIGDAINSPTMLDIGTWGARVLPFQGLYQGGLDALTADTRGITGVIVQLGPFGGAQATGAGMWIWSALFTAGVLGIAVAAFGRRDL